MRHATFITLCALWLIACGGAGATTGTNEPAATEKRCPGPPPQPAQGKAPRLMVQDGHTTTVNWMALSADGSLLATAAMDGALRLWDTRSGMLVRRSIAYGAMNGVELNGAGTVVAYAYARPGQKPHAVRVEQIATGKHVQFPCNKWAYFRLAPDGKTIAVADKRLIIYDVATGKARHTIALDADARALGQDLEGKRIAVGISGRVSVIDAATGQQLWQVTIEDGEDDFKRSPFDVALVGERLLIKRWDHYELVERAGTVKKLGAYDSALVSGGSVWLGGRQGVRRLDLDRATLGEALEVGSELFRLALSADGSTLALAYAPPGKGSPVRLVDMRSQRVMRTIDAQDTRVSGLGVSPSGDQLAVGSQSAVSLWSLPSGEKTFSSPPGRYVRSRALLYGPQGRQLVSHEVPMIRVRDPRSGHLLRAWKPDSVEFVAFRPGSARLLTLNMYGVVMEWDLSEVPKTTGGDPDDYRPFRQPPGKRLAKLKHWVESAVLSPDGKRLFINQPQGYDTENKVPKSISSMLDAETLEELWSTDFQNINGRHVAFSADGARLLMSTQVVVDPTFVKPMRRVLRSYDAATGKLLAEVDTKVIGPIAVRRNAMLVAGEAPAIIDAEQLTVRRMLPLRDVFQMVVLPHPTLDAFLIGSQAGTTTLVKSDGSVQAMLIATPGGDYVASTPDGAYRSSLDGARRLAWAFDDPMEAFSFEQFAARYERPELVTQRLSLKGSESLPPVSRPPRVELTGERERTTDAASFPLSLTTSSSGRVDRLRVYVNGRLTNDELVCKPSADMKLDVPLQPGRNRVAVIASDADGFASNAQMLDVESKAAGKRPDLWVVTVGVSKYPKLAQRHQLEFADDDARSIADAMKKLAGEGKPFAKAHVMTLTDAQVTVKGTEKALASLSKMRPDDLAVVFLAGHGLRLDDGQMRFLTQGASLKRAEANKYGVGWDRLEQALAAAPGRVLMLLDACHSGHVTTEPIAPNDAMAKALAAQNRSGVLVFAASRGSQLSYEVGGSGGGSRGLELAWDDKPARSTAGLAQGHGLFTSAMLEALSGEVPDRDNSGAVELSEMIDYVRERVRQASNGQQTPWVARRELFGDFTLLPAR